MEFMYVTFVNSAEKTSHLLLCHTRILHACHYTHVITCSVLHLFRSACDHSSFLRRNPLDEPREITTFLPYDSRDVDTLAISRRLIAVHEPSQIKHQLDPAANRQK